MKLSFMKHARFIMYDKVKTLHETSLNVFHEVERSLTS